MKAYDLCCKSTFGSVMCFHVVFVLPLNPSPGGFSHLLQFVHAENTTVAPKQLFPEPLSGSGSVGVLFWFHLWFLHLLVDPFLSDQWMKVFYEYIHLKYIWTIFFIAFLLFGSFEHVQCENKPNQIGKSNRSNRHGSIGHLWDAFTHTKYNDVGI